VSGRLAWLARQRIVNHLRENPQGVQAVTDHVLLPVLGKKPKEAKEAKPEPKNVKAAELV
jgi:hypothetical protein